MKYSPSFKRDWEFYLRIKSEFTFCGKSDSEIQARIIPSTTGRTAKECFLFLDGMGKVVPCAEPELLFEVLRVKAAINWQIRQWAEMLSEGVLMPSELVRCRDSRMGSGGCSKPSWEAGLAEALDQPHKELVGSSLSRISIDNRPALL